MKKDAVSPSAQRKSKSGVVPTAGVCLEVVGGPMDGLACRCKKGPAKIGRVTSNDLPLTLDKYASGNHALVGFEEGRYWLEDPKSKNGTWLDGNELPRNTRLELSPGKTFVVASTAVELLRSGEAPEVTAPADVQARVKDVLKKLSPTASQVMEVAEQEARSAASCCLNVRHVFLGLCKLEDRSLTRLFEDNEIDRESLSKAVRGFAMWTGEREWVGARIAFFSDRDEPQTEDKIRFTPRVAKVMTEARELARTQGSTAVQPLHLLYGILSEGRNVPVTVLRQMGKDAAAMAEGAKAALVDKAEPLLSKIGRNLTDLAREGRFSPLIGRDEETRKITDVLSRSSKNNALIVGRTGVGKTALVQGLAQTTARPNCPKEIRGKSVIEIPTDQLMEGVKSAKELERRLLELAKSARQSEDTILFFDDIHLLLTSGRGGGGAAVAPAVLADAFGDDDVWCVTTTTEEGYATYFENDPVLKGCFEAFPLQELSEETTKSILRYLKGVFEGRYNVRIADEAVSSAVTLAAQYVTNVRLPSKAVQALDEACAFARSQEPANSAGAISIGPANIAGVVSEWTGLAVEALLGERPEVAAGVEYEKETAEGETEKLLSQHGAWLMAREISERISSLQSEYHLADAWDRRAALKELIRSELTRVPPERRHLVAAYLRDMFPVAEGAPQLTEEIHRLRAQLAELRQQVGARADSGRLTGAVGEALLGREVGEEQGAESGMLALKAVRELLKFAGEVEKLTKAFLEALLAQGGSQATRFDLPYWGKDIERLMTEIAENQSEESPIELARYLSDLSCWLMACVVGYQQAAPKWCVDFLDKMSPRSIEQRANLPPWKKVAGLASSELWDLYTSMVRDMHPDLVGDQVRDKAAEIAKQQYGILKRSSKSSTSGRQEG